MGLAMRQVKHVRVGGVRSCGSDGVQFCGTQLTFSIVTVKSPGFTFANRGHEWVLKVHLKETKAMVTLVFSPSTWKVEAVDGPEFEANQGLRRPRLHREPRFQAKQNKQQQTPKIHQPQKEKATLLPSKQ